MKADILQASEVVRQLLEDQAETGIVLGTGLGRLVEHIENQKEIPYSDIPGFPEATVEFHQGVLVAGRLCSHPVLAMKGRFHFYEGYSFQQITFPIRVMKALGIKSLLLSNAAGALNKSFKKGSLMMITDHINLLPGNPLIGPNDDSIGTRFPDMSCPYDKNMCARLKSAANSEDIQLQEGVYAAVQGPMLETKAEYRYLGRIGADAVGMSTVPEVIAARHMDLPCAAISVLTDECDPDNLAPVDIREIIEVAGKAEEQLIRLTLQYFQSL